ncbi:UNVERIFIED_CONTAM: hypothetical protein K2H54_058404 [Gekko kuhli]
MSATCLWTLVSNDSTATTLQACSNTLNVDCGDLSNRLWTVHFKIMRTAVFVGQSSTFNTLLQKTLQPQIVHFTHFFSPFMSRRSYLQDSLLWHCNFTFLPETPLNLFNCTQTSCIKCSVVAALLNWNM